MAVCGNRALQYVYSIIWTLRLGCGLNGCLFDGIRHSISVQSLARSAGGLILSVRVDVVYVSICAT